MKTWVVALAVLAASMPVLADGGAEADAPNDMASAMDVAPGTYAGTLPWDDVDWYRVVVPAGRAVVATVSPRAGDWLLYGVELRSDDGALLARGARSSVSGPGVTLSTGTGTGAVRVGVIHDFFSGPNYTLALALVDAADLRVRSIVVERPPIETEAGDAPNPTRFVVVEVENVGTARSVSARVEVWTTHPGHPAPERRDLGSVPFVLVPGASTAVRIPWDTVGQAGDVDVHARTFAALDAAPENDETVVRDSIFFTGAERGIDAFNTALSVSTVRVGTDHDASGSGVGVAGPASAGVVVSPGSVRLCTSNCA